MNAPIPNRFLERPDSTAQDVDTSGYRAGTDVPRRAADDALPESPFTGADWLELQERQRRERAAAAGTPRTPAFPDSEMAAARPAAAETRPKYFIRTELDSALSRAFGEDVDYATLESIKYLEIVPAASATSALTLFSPRTGDDIHVGIESTSHQRFVLGTTGITPAQALERARIAAASPFFREKGIEEIVGTDEDKALLYAAALHVGLRVNNIPMLVSSLTEAMDKIANEDAKLHSPAVAAAAAADLDLGEKLLSDDEVNALLRPLDNDSSEPALDIDLSEPFTAEELPSALPEPEVTFIDAPADDESAPAVSEDERALREFLAESGESAEEIERTISEIRADGTLQPDQMAFQDTLPDATDAVLEDVPAARAEPPAPGVELPVLDEEASVGERETPAEIAYRTALQAAMSDAKQAGQPFDSGAFHDTYISPDAREILTSHGLDEKTYLAVRKQVEAGNSAFVKGNGSVNVSPLADAFGNATMEKSAVSAALKAMEADKVVETTDHAFYHVRKNPHAVPAVS